MKILDSELKLGIYDILDKEGENLGHGNLDFKSENE